MENKIESYVEELFSNGPFTAKAYEMKVEMIQNLKEKYRDLIEQGVGETDAYNITLSSIGNVNELFATLEDNTTYYPVSEEVQARRVASMFTAVSIMLYILSLIPLLVLQNLAGFIIMLIVVAFATGLLVFVQMNKPKNSGAEEIRVNNRKFQVTKQLRNSISSTFWILIVVLYFIVSFNTGRWATTWLIFLIGALLENIMRAILNIYIQK